MHQLNYEDNEWNMNEIWMKWNLDQMDHEKMKSMNEMRMKAYFGSST